MQSQMGHGYSVENRPSEAEVRELWATQWRIYEAEVTARIRTLEIELRRFERYAAKHPSESREQTRQRQRLRYEIQQLRQRINDEARERALGNRDELTEDQRRDVIFIDAEGPHGPFFFPDKHWMDYEASIAEEHEMRTHGGGAGMRRSTYGEAMDNVFAATVEHPEMVGQGTRTHLNEEADLAYMGDDGIEVHPMDERFNTLPAVQAALAAGQPPDEPMVINTDAASYRFWRWVEDYHRQIRAHQHEVEWDTPVPYPDAPELRRFAFRKLHEEKDTMTEPERAAAREYIAALNRQIAANREAIAEARRTAPVYK